jgi:predicted MPP superfamily phosphohydrolase
MGAPAEEPNEGARAESDEQLTVALLSDMHAYAKDRKGREDEPSHLECSMLEDDAGRHPVVGLEQMIDQEEISADLLLCGGDLGDKADTAGIEYAWRQVQRLGAKLKVDQIIATAGNHDLDSRYQDTPYSPKEVLQRLTPGFPLSESSAKCDQYWSRNFAVVNGPHCRVVTLNSCAYHGEGAGEEHHGRVSNHTLVQLRQELDAVDPPEINILLCHHHPVFFTDIGDDDYGSIRGGPGLLDLLRSGKYGRWLVIHGHRHMPHLTYGLGGAASPVIFSAASFSVDLHLNAQAEARNQFYLLRFPLQQTRQLGLSLAGRFQSWYWVPRRGWEETPADVALPAEGGFGYREDGRVIAGSIERFMKNAPRQSMSWGDLVVQFPSLRFLTPEDIALTKVELDRRGAGLVPRKGRGIERVEFP